MASRRHVRAKIEKIKAKQRLMSANPDKYKTCDSKIKYPTMKDAQDIIRYLHSVNGWQYRKPYQCRYCGSFHLSKKKLKVPIPEINK